MAFRTDLVLAAKRFGASIFPSVIFDPGWGLLRTRRIEIAGLPLDVANREALRTAARRGEQLRVVLPPAALFRRKHMVRRSAMSKAAAAIAIELRQAMPAQANGLIWHLVFEKVEGDLAEYSVYIARKDLVLALKSEIESHGAILAGIDIRGAGILVECLDGGEPRRRWLAGALGLGIAMVIAVSFVAWNRAESATTAGDRLAARLAGLKNEAVKLRTELDTRESQSQSLAADLAEFGRGRGRAALLSSLSSALPDTAWLSELAISGTGVDMAGFTTGEVSSVLAALQGVPALQSPQLTAPALVDSLSGETRFQVRAVLPGEGMP